MIGALPKLKYEHEPDTHFIYSNIGYAILGAALSRAAGQPYTDYVRENIFVPLGMVHTQFEPDDQMISALAKRYVLHDGLADPKQPAEELKNGRGYKIPNGAVFTPVGDLARFVSFEMGYGSETVLQKKLLLESRSQVFWADENAAMGYGIGFMLVRQGDVVGLGHGGSVAGFLAGAYFHPPSHIGITFLRNAEGHGFEPQLMVRMLGVLAEQSRRSHHWTWIVTALLTRLPEMRKMGTWPDAVAGAELLEARSLTARWIDSDRIAKNICIEFGHLCCDVMEILHPLSGRGRLVRHRRME